jgi:hypothetical protein
MSEIRIDLHVHSNFSDGKYSIREIVDIFGRLGVHAIAITDHVCESMNLIGQVSHRLKYSLSEANFEKYLDTIYKEARRAWILYGMLVMPGFEITKNSFNNNRSAHLLVIGTEKWISPDLEIEEILKLARAEQALTIAAHPLGTGSFEFQTYQLWSKRHHYGDLIDAWEVNSRKIIFTKILNSNLPIIANSDFHNESHLASWRTKLYCELNQNEIFKAIREERVDFYLDSTSLSQLAPYNLDLQPSSLIEL